MFQLDCGTVVKDCPKKLRATSREELAAAIRDHARSTHKFDTISPELAEKIMSHARPMVWSRLLIPEE
jgi:predicted small metal-binding protein